jgi:DNA-binding MarR family transcriptional regulator
LEKRLDIKDSAGLDILVAMRATWWSHVPVALAREEPGMLTRLLDLGLRARGISQSELRRELGINQPRLSKLMKKLLDERWIRVKQSETDSRVKLMTTTPTARDRIASLRTDLGSLLAAKAARLTTSGRRKPSASPGRKRIKPVPGQQPFELID